MATEQSVADDAADEITFGLELAGLIGVFAISLLGPWENDGSGWGFYTSAFVLCITAFFAGRRRQWWTSLAAGAAVGFVGCTLYIIGSVVVYELGWYGKSWDDFGETNYNTSLIVLLILFYGIPAGGIGAMLAGVGHFAVNRWGGA